MDHALIKIGLPVKCDTCKVKGFVKPDTDYNGWYKSQMFRMRPGKRWYCPEHAEVAKDFEDRFYQRYKTPEPVATVEDSTEELYKLLD